MSTPANRGIDGIVRAQRVRRAGADTKGVGYEGKTRRNRRMGRVV
jgi:hypothetical protein